MRRVYCPWLFVIVAGILATACGGPKQESTRALATAVSAPELIPVAPLQVPELLAARRGNVVLVNVWATWCLPCREEFPDLMRVHRELGARGLDLVLISADFEAQRESARAFLSRQGVDFETYHKSGTDEAFIDAVDPAWSGTLPATLVLRRDGSKAAFWEGIASYEEFKNAVEPLL